MSSNQEWIQTLPKDLQQQISLLVAGHPSSLPVLQDMYTYFSSTIAEQDEKRRKTNEATEVKVERASSDSTGGEVKPYVPGQINEQEIIFELPQISFQSPIRKKMNLIFHLLIEPNQQPKPVMLIALPTTYVPEISIHDLANLIRLCVLLPILGNSTTNTKRNIGLLCFWIHDTAAADPNKNDPIICQVNFDQVKKQLIKAGKIPPEAETQLKEMHGSNESQDGIKAINEAIINFLQRQFQLCGIHLINYLPSSNPFKNKLTVNTDAGVAVSHKANLTNDLVMVEAYKGARDGSILMLAANEFCQSFMIFGFKKPILIFDISKIEHISYSNITRLTFSMIVTVVNEKKDSKVEILEFGMIDQKYFLILDEFIKNQGINDNSFDDQLREKSAVEVAGDQQDAVQAAPADSDDEEEDGTYQGGQEQEAESSVDEEYDSNAGSDSGSEGEDDGDVDGETEDNTTIDPNTANTADVPTAGTATTNAADDDFVTQNTEEDAEQ